MIKDVFIKELYTAEGENRSPDSGKCYPRPQMRRREWTSLDGEWTLEAEGGTGKINVPFCPESLLSGFEHPVRYGETLRYTRRFSVPESWRGMRIIIHFGAVSRRAEVFVNGKGVAEHNNAYLPFSADVTDALAEGENVLAVEAVNDLSTKYPYGKQKIVRGGMWYTPVSGIWQSVWIEPVPERRIESLSVKCDMTGADIEVTGAAEGEVVCLGKRYPIEDGHARVEPDEIKLWSPESPYLYGFTVKCGGDEVESYFALRTLTVENIGGVMRLCLNGKPYFFHGLLDQGYFSDGIYTPATPAMFEKDILAMKSLGFNTLRKHIKIEPEQFYYDCDRLGMIVFQDMVNNGRYRFFHDTALPTLGVRSLSDKKTNRDEETRREFLSSMEKTVRHLSNHASICLWTIFNEGWGQFDADGAYEKLRALDPSRFIDSASGWFTASKTDVDSGHIYFGKLKLGKRREKPQILSEFGGYVWKDPEHSFNLRKTYGYKIFDSREDFAAAFRKVYLDEVVPLAREGLCASVWTQVSDVEDETNGIFTYDRKVLKLTPEEANDIGEALQKAVSE
ncbi:MAG: glycoside hydrolase family 2 [Clostridia bacterium]|nr:glycoside hydrolase family 2 [Clostridia bacterium]